MIQKTAETTGDLITFKIGDSQKLHQRTIQKQMKKYLEKDIYIERDR